MGLQTVNQIAVIDTLSKAVVKRISLGTDSPGGLAVNAAESRLYVASNMSNTLIVIDIAGSNAIEVGRVTVHDSAISNPEGVVLSTDGKTAYIANSGKGSVATVSLDEANNIYTRTGLVALGANTQPMGLALNSAGSKLYVASYNGTASVINTATNGVTNLPVAAGYSVAVSNDNSKVYFPAAGLDKLYVADGSADTVSATTYSVPGAPWGSAIAPNGNLYMAMYSGPDSAKVFDTTSNTVTSTISLPAGAKPISMGDFVGPDFSAYTINATNGAGCTISPSGIIPVTQKGWTFTITGACDVKVNGTSVGSPSVYTFTNLLQAANTIDASVAPVTYTLSGDWISSYGGWLVSSPVGINKTTKSAQFAANQTVILSVGDSSLHAIQSGSWTGDCAGSATTCTLTMTGNKTFGATIIPKPTGTGPIYNATKSSYHQTLAEATAAATTGDIIKISTLYVTGGTTTGTAGVKVTLSGAWSSDFGSQIAPVSMGQLIIKDVAVIADKLTL